MMKYYGVLLRVVQRVLWRRFVNTIFTCVCVPVCLQLCSVYTSAESRTYNNIIYI